MFFSNFFNHPIGLNNGSWNLFFDIYPTRNQCIGIFLAGIAEKATIADYKLVESLGNGAQLLEGYGSTETIGISMNRPNISLRGVGPLLPNVELQIVHPETLEPLPCGSEGEICVSGSGIFSGYIGLAFSPFIELFGKRWYRTGDLGYLDKDHYLFLSGRIKRFIKLGGEMISLGAVETSLIQKLQDQSPHDLTSPFLVVCAEEQPDASKLILFSTLILDKERVNLILRQSGFSNLIKIFKVIHLESIPLIGVGKLDYAELQRIGRADV